LGKLTERDPLQYTGIDGRITLKWIFGKWEGGMDSIHVDQKRNRWWDLVNAAMKLRPDKIRGYFFTSPKTTNFS